MIDFKRIVSSVSVHGATRTTWEIAPTFPDWALDALRADGAVVTAGVGAIVVTANRFNVPLGVHAGVDRLAGELNEELREVVPPILNAGQWHLPYITLDDLRARQDIAHYERWAMISAGRVLRALEGDKATRPAEEDERWAVIAVMSTGMTEMSAFLHAAEVKRDGDKLVWTCWFPGAQP